MAHWKQEDARPLNKTDSWLTPGHVYGHCHILSSASGRVYSHQDRRRPTKLARKDIAMNASSVRLCGKIKNHRKKPQSFLRFSLCPNRSQPRTCNYGYCPGGFNELFDNIKDGGYLAPA
ncbi:uncharacterized protein NFIA_059810 [Aspergillus fischeri NRRL 181]|uniref:Uncharacterized protein n=1 Tax=Neosartorya fischeri (strain ATCC 1020 / DSM 3700 / CBS 544.65 / FGSC A1164 / JCM 1740 / NRRL 181 / WB 181) TaxID=331117 RepID=A1DPA5_NEOFI|nr:uncharacterized protein NFIA_059810 [Aspergillus fischeri NRRL 181]EAW16626.1 hypothetical protein NFIA_059810 [Aspergillus fischeri NRRL 181]